MGMISHSVSSAVYTGLTGLKNLRDGITLSVLCIITELQDQKTMGMVSRSVSSALKQDLQD